MFAKTQLISLLAMGIPMAEAMGIPLKRNLLETGEDFRAMAEASKRFTELMESSAELCENGVSIERVNAITADAVEFKDALAHAKAEIKDRTLGGIGPKKTEKKASK